MSVGAAVAFVVGTGLAIKGQKDTAKARKEQGAVKSASQRNEDVSRGRQAARQARIKQAQIAQAAESLGTSASSSTGSAVGSLTTQVNENKARLEGQQLTAQALSRQSQKAADGQVTQTLGQGIANVGAQAFDKSGGFDNLFKD